MKTRCPAVLRPLIAAAATLAAMTGSPARAACADFFAVTGTPVPDICPAIDAVNAKGAVPLLLGRTGCPATQTGTPAACPLWTAFPLPAANFGAILAFHPDGTYALDVLGSDAHDDAANDAANAQFALAEAAYLPFLAAFFDLPPGGWMITDPATIDPADAFQTALLAQNPWISDRIAEGALVVYVVRGE